MSRPKWLSSYTGRKPRRCVYCGEVGPRVIVLRGWAHRRCVKENKKSTAPSPSRGEDAAPPTMKEE